MKKEIIKNYNTKKIKQNYKINELKLKLSVCDKWEYNNPHPIHAVEFMRKLQKISFFKKWQNFKVFIFCGINKLSIRNETKIIIRKFPNQFIQKTKIINHKKRDQVLNSINTFLLLKKIKKKISWW